MLPWPSATSTVASDAAPAVPLIRARFPGIMAVMGASPQEFFRSQGPVTDLGPHAALARDPPADVPRNPPPEVLA